MRNDRRRHKRQLRRLQTNNLQAEVVVEHVLNIAGNMDYFLRRAQLPAMDRVQADRAIREYQRVRILFDQAKRHAARAADSR